mgnify:CR=1 FL=1
MSLPIYNFRKFPKSKTNVTFSNYEDGESPRKNIEKKDFHYHSFKDAEIQIKNILTHD